MITTHTYEGGRLGNVLYYVLQMYIKSRCDTEIQHKYFVRRNREVIGQINNLNLGSFITTSPGDSTIRHTDYGQRLGIDYTEDDIGELISKYILSSPTVTRIKEEFKALGSSENVSLHIRNGDYINSSARRLYAFYDRKKYIEEASNLFDAKALNAYVFTDDIEFTKLEYDSFLKTLFNSVTYMPAESAETSMMKMSLFKNKIIMNSTFSTWAGYIGEVLYADTGCKVVAPDRVISSSDFTIYKPSWYFIRTDNIKQEVNS